MPAIQHVTDTALWVAYYRALESDRPDALFKDDLAKTLVGSRGSQIAESMKATSRYTQWTVVIRTCIIDRLIQERVAQGVDMVINLGAGLDTRPYRLSLPHSLRWIEVDYPQMMDYKTRLLDFQQNSTLPTVQLERISLDLSDRPQRQRLFAELSLRTQKALILTEGVVPYLTEDQVATLAEDLRAVGPFHYWIAEYLAPQLYRHFKNPRRMAMMKNAPFRFFPDHWLGFFENHGWKAREMRYLAQEAIQLGRPMPLPLWAIAISALVGKNSPKHYRRQAGYVVLEPRRAL